MRLAVTGKEYKLAIRIAGVIDKSYTASLATAKTQLNANVAEINKSFTSLDKGFDATMKVGQNCFKTIATASGVAAAAITAAAAASIVAGSNFESAFAGVKKTVDATEEEYAMLRQNILDMSKEIPSSASEIANVMEIAGQLGIATDSLTEFTKVMINLGVSTNLSAEDAATALAKFANVVSMPDFDENGISNYERLGSVIVDLGNNFATTEQDIVTMATRLASTGDIVGLSEAQIMALATAMSSVDIEAEAGGSTMSKLLRKIQLAVETGSSSLQDYASVANMTGEEFSQVFKDDAVVALSAFIDGLNDTERNGKSAVAILDDMDIKEIRLTNTILALANASGVMSNAIDTANKAWDENTALAIEAGKRYETVESKMQIMKNAFVDLGISAYEDLREPLVDAIGFSTDKIEELNKKISGANGVSKWINDIGTSIPTLKRKITTNGKPILTFFDSLKDVFDWIVKHKSAVIGSIEGIATALIAYKIASTISHITTSIMSFTATLTTAKWLIMYFTTAIAGLSAIIYTYNNAQREILKNNLSKHFGDMALTLQDLERVAENIVNSGSLTAVDKALEAFGDLDDISATMKEATSKLDKLNWKVSIGIKLNPDEQEDYKTAISDYVTAAQNYAQQSQYAVALNLSVAFDENDENGADVVSKVNQFYQDKYDRLSELGTKLNEAVTDAFNDGLLDIKEAQTISNIQAAMAEVEEQLATGEFEAKMSVLQLDYSGKDLTSDAFQNLQDELNKQIETATESYKEAYVKNFASIKAAYEAGDYLSDEEYNNALESLKEKYLENVSNIQQKAAEFQMNTITDAYSDEISEAKKKWEDTLDEQFGEEYAQSWAEKSGAMWQQVYDTMSSTAYFDSADRTAISNLLDALKPTMEEMQNTIDEYTAAGKEVPKALSDGMKDYEALLALTNSTDSVMNAIGESIANTDKYDGIMNMLDEKGMKIPEQVATSIQNNSDKAKDACTQLYDEVNETLTHLFSKGISVDAAVNLNLSAVYDNSGNLTGPYSNDYIEQNSKMKLKLPGHADGGIFTDPHIAAFCENGMESVIPIDGSANALSLWEKTGQLLGLSFNIEKQGGSNAVSMWQQSKNLIDMSGNFNTDTLHSQPSGPVTIEYKPTLQFYGEAPSSEDIQNALSISQSEFEELMDRYLKENGRSSF